MNYDLELDTGEYGALESMVRVTDAEGAVVWEGKTRDLHELLMNRWAAFTPDELFGIYSIVSGYAESIDPQSPLKIMRAECVAELERRRR